MSYNSIQVSYWGVLFPKTFGFFVFRSFSFVFRKQNPAFVNSSYNLVQHIIRIHSNIFSGLHLWDPC